MYAPNRSNMVGAYLALAFGVVCIGFSAIFVRFAGVPGPVSAFYRILIASIVIVPWWLHRRTKWPSRVDLVLTLAGGVFFALDLILWNTSVMLTSATNATLLANNAPLWVGIGALVLFRERLSTRYWAGLAIALTGITILVGIGAWMQLRLSRGDMLAIGASFFYAAYLLTAQQARVRIDTSTFTAISVSSSLLLLFGLNLVLGTTMTGYSVNTWGALVGLGLVSHLGGWLSINYALGHLRAARVAVGVLGQAMVTALLSIPLLGESLSVNQIVGGVLVLSGIYIANQAKSKGRQDQRSENQVPNIEMNPKGVTTAHDCGR